MKQLDFFIEYERDFMLADLIDLIDQIQSRMKSSP